MQKATLCKIRTMQIRTKQGPTVPLRQTIVWKVKILEKHQRILAPNLPLTTSAMALVSRYVITILYTTDSFYKIYKVHYNSTT